MESDDLDSEEDKWEPPMLDHEGETPSPSTSAQSAKTEIIRVAKHSCGETVPENHKFCHGCGGMIEKTIFDLDESTKSKEQMESELEEGPNKPLKFGTVGRSGMGKSSFINIILNKKLEDEDYAITGRNDTTKEPKLYIHSKHRNFTIWDTPGFGNLNMTRNDFLKSEDLETFDFFFIFFDTIPQNDDLWIARKLTELNVPFCLVRCKLDILLEDVKKPQTVKSVIEELRSSLKSTMERYDVLKNSRTFLISNLPIYFQYSDWTDLLLFVAEQIPVVKREALFFILPILTPETLTLKYNELRRRINKVSSLAAIIAASPIPFLDAPINIALVVREVRRYRDVLGLNSNFAKHHAPADTSIKDKVIEGLGMVSTAAFSGAIATAGILLSNVDVLIPVVGSAISAVSVNEIVSYYLNKTLDQTYEEAKNLYQKVTTPNKQ